MRGMKIAAGMVLAGVLATPFNAAGANDGRVLQTEQQFTDEAATLLGKSGYGQEGAVGYAYYPNVKIAQIVFGINKGDERGKAYIACSPHIVLERDTHCRIGSVSFKPVR